MGCGCGVFVWLQLYYVIVGNVLADDQVRSASTFPFAANAFAVRRSPLGWFVA